MSKRKSGLPSESPQPEKALSTIPPEPDFAQPVNGLLTLAAVLLVFCVAARLVTSWHNFGDLFTTSGVWTAMAVDIADDGTLYRPLISPLGYGGTRYAPLYPVLQAGLMRLGMTPINSGYLLTLFAMAAGAAGLYTLMRRMRVASTLAATITCFAMASNCFLEGVAQIHGDPLALALELWGLVIVFTLADRVRRDGWMPITLGATCFAFAAAAKVTSIFGIASAFAWLILHRQRKDALRLAIIWAIEITVLILATQWASDGRAIGIFRRTAAGGGGFTSLAQGPHRFADALLHSDHVVFGFWVLALALVLIRRSWNSLPALLLFVTTAGTIAIFGSPGTGINHLMSLQAASVLVVGVGLLQLRALRLVAIVAVLFLVAVGIFNCVRQVREIREEHARDSLEIVLNDVRQSSVSGSIYANDPFIPILANQRPYLLDGFMARLMRQKDPASAEKLWDDLEQARFSAVITNVHPADWTDVVADDALVARHLDKYHLESVRGSFQIYLPNPR
jgi:hypothetical protein